MGWSRRSAVQLRYGPHPAPDARGDTGELAGDVRREKVDRDAAEWLPAQNRCWFAARVIAVRQRRRRKPAVHLVDTETDERITVFRRGRRLQAADGGRAAADQAADVRADSGRPWCRSKASSNRGMMPHGGGMEVLMGSRWTESADTAVRLAAALDWEHGGRRLVDLAERLGRTEGAVRQRASRRRAVQLEGDVDLAGGGVGVDS